MDGVELFGPILDYGTSFLPATLRGAGIRFADFSGLKLSDDHLSRLVELLSETFGDSSVTLPKEIDPPASWRHHNIPFDDWRTQWRAFQEEIGYTPPP